MSIAEVDPRNIITGTRELNDAMAVFEKQVMRYVQQTGGHVLYRVSPDFRGRELVTHGVSVEAISAEDGGAHIYIDAYIPNVQSGVVIDYATGASCALTPCSETV